ncbi:methionine aminopeptidase 1 [Biomphalaria glabrata]|uniref:Methionine aminopeptidase n=1 Tax=Biomphalaria glabrata TaxID=6526 RepID=A0A2C9JFY6_BIOGL|nr:methionine aminopeptidase 1-like [Biomphalaria glabrata]KAI8731515.1 methionine aminopeptidase 1-like [Biomphalaria glabrata]KAI8796544.1 methionine aminopeptidase 1 [Biomphalaria glabrata]
MSLAVSSRICDSPGCGEAAKLQCPTCIKIGIPGSYFCSQECFKGAWGEHKKLHKLAKAQENGEKSDNDNYNPWPGFRFTGSLRPAPLSATRTVPDNITRPDYANHPNGISESEKQMRGTTNIRILTDEEQEGMRTVCRLTREILDVAAQATAVGVTTDEIDRLVHEATIDRDCYPSPLNYFEFPKSCCTSINEVICHGIPDMRPLQDGDIMNVDISAYHRGYHGDANETFFVGNVSENAKKLVKTTYECLKLAIDEVKPGVRYREIGNIIQKHAQANGFSVVRSYCGHGINELFHTAPSVPHYGKNKAIGIMKPGQVFTIEPMINEGTWRDELWPDNWTAVTQDGKLSAQFEHTLLVTEIGCEVLTRRLDNNGQPHFMDTMSS